MAQEISRADRDIVFNRLKLLLERLMKITEGDNLKNSPQWNWNTDIFSDIGVDSVDAIDLTYAIEEEFGVKTSLNDAKLRRKLSDIVDYIIELSSKKD